MNLQLEGNLSTSLNSSHAEIFRPLKRRKVIFLGSPGVGKSAIMMRFKDDVFFDYYEPTIQNSVKKTCILNDEYIELELIDIDGQTEYTIFSFSKFSFGIHGYFLVYSIESRQSFELIRLINSKLAALAGREVPKVLVANKCDLTKKRMVSFEEGKAYAKSIGCPFIECSAKSSDNINKAFHNMLVEINKYESNVDFKALMCKKTLKCFVKREKQMRILFFIMMNLNIVSHSSLTVASRSSFLGLWNFPWKRNSTSRE